MAPKTPHPTTYDDELQREIAEYNRRHAQPMVTLDMPNDPDGGIPDNDPDWIAWKKRYPKTQSTEQK